MKSFLLLLGLSLPLLASCGEDEDTEDKLDTGAPADTGNDTGSGDTQDTQDTDSYEPYGPDNDWWHADIDDVPPDLAGTGMRNGSVAPDFTFTDQNGDEVELYQFYGQVILLDVFSPT